ncbi:MAG: PAS domain-containing protein, partial [Ilumatobacteraceae bacterium]
MLARDAPKRRDLRAGASQQHHTDTWIGTAIDTEDQQQLAQSLENAQREAAENTALLETLHSASPVGFGFVDRDLRVVSLNAALASVNGTAIESQLGRRVADMVPELWPQLEPVFRGVLDTGTSVIDIELNGPAAGD